MARTAGIVIIGDEILNGHVIDTNSHYLFKKLWSLGVVTKESTVLKDEVHAICECVKEYSVKYDMVLVAGGTGSTHDDVTYIGIAEAFNEKCCLNADLCNDIKEFFNLTHVNSAVEKLATLPSSSRRHYNVFASTVFPLVQVKNVFVFPGVPKYLKLLFEYVMQNIIDKGLCKPQLKILECKDPEIKIAEQVSQIQKMFADHVSIGIYPVVDCQTFQAKIHVEGIDEKKINECLDTITKTLTPGVVAPMTTVPRQLSSDDLQHLDNIVNSSLEIINKGLLQYGIENIAVAFNGGKDCTVLLQLVTMAIRKLIQEELTITAICIDDPENFTEIEEFVEASVKRYNLRMLKFKGKIKDGLFQLTSQMPHIKAVLMGTRNTDPFSSKLKPFDPCDVGWPELTRVNPMLTWSYSDVWLFLRKYNVPYCSLYDAGYTSIGNRTNTKRNPALLDTETGVYRPAYCLSDGASERAGRG